MNQSSFRQYSIIVFITVFLVILAGGIVRTTQSGMGCPDWPRCFGQWIPPTNESQLPANYKQLYAFKYVDLSFNAFHTWIEYINRLLGMILGLLILVQFIWSLKFWKSNRKIVWLSGFALFLTGFQGYLGSKVVEANLEVVKITIHMLVALIIAALSLMIVNETISLKIKVSNKNLKTITVATMFLLLIQIILGTQVRQQIDDISKSLNFSGREQWISRLNTIFYIHRSFSLIIAAACIYLFIKYQKTFQLKLSNILILVSVLGNILVGVIMTYFNIPAAAQPVHLMLSSILLMSLFFNWLNTSSYPAVKNSVSY